MNAAFERLERLFATALALPAAERGAFLERECAGQPALRQKLEALLTAHVDAGDLLEPPAALPLAELRLPEPLPQERPGAQIGRYMLVEKIGEGGCGSVFLAEQTDLVRRRVALKIVKLGMDTRDVIARFEAERHALALMDHPNIARVFDAGATDTGRPFFAMEFVPGIKITEYCERHRCTLAERLNLFVQVCHAIQHAHHKGVIHRDIKPSNILITLHDGAPVPKVIDFGIAKATQGRLTEETLLTAREQFIGTPAYVSPEQAEGSDRDIDTRSDVYSLGMLLYELLAGRPPFETKQLVAGGLTEMRRQIRDVDPLRPSAQLQRLEAAPLAQIAHRRQTAPADLIQAVGGDLDWIVMRCLEKDRARRYQTALGLARDVQRHLAHEPVDASPPSLYYTFRKFARRHRGALAAGGAAIVLLVATAAISLHLALAARRAEQRAESEAAAARQTIAFLQNDLLAPGSGETPVWDLRLRTVLDRANRSLDGRFADQPLVETSLRETLAATYHALGEYAIEQQHWLRALALRRALHGPEARETLHVMSQLAAAHESMGRYAEAEKLAHAALAVQRRVLGPHDPVTLRSMHRLASIYWNQGRGAESVELHKETFRARTAVLGADHPDTLASMQDMAQANRGFGELTTAAFWGLKVLEAKRGVLGAEHPDTLGAMNSLAMTYRAQGRLADAETLHRQVLAARTRLLGPEHPETLASVTNLAFVHQDQGRLDEAEKLTTQTLEIKRRALGVEHPSTLNSMSILGIIQLAQHRLAEAAEAHAAVLAIRQRTLGAEHPDTLISMHYLGATRCAQGDLGAAEPLLRTALDLRRRVLKPTHPETLRTMEELARLCLALQKFDEAEPLLAKSIEVRNRSMAKMWRTGLVRGWWGDALLGLKRANEAQMQFELSYKILAQPSDTAPIGAEAIVREAAERLLALYTAQGRRWQADAMRKRLADLPPAK